MINHKKDLLNSINKYHFYICDNQNKIRYFRDLVKLN